ncbi:hypothetical protein GQ54DRAFT_140824 [Martensiomyces pterosporus]|nr:hypothetical protein GQ54DRAFT_140824 [Martensiomyces pterosporus]
MEIQLIGNLAQGRRKGADSGDKWWPAACHNMLATVAAAHLPLIAISLQKCNSPMRCFTGAQGLQLEPIPELRRIARPSQLLARRRTPLCVQALLAEGVLAGFDLQPWLFWRCRCSRCQMARARYPRGVKCSYSSVVNRPECAAADILPVASATSAAVLTLGVGACPSIRMRMEAYRCHFHASCWPPAPPG